MCSPLKDVAHQTGISEHLPSGTLGNSPIPGTCTAASWAWQKDMTDSAHPALGSDVRGTLASPTDTAGTPDPSAFQGVILHSPRVSGLSLKNSTQCSEQSQEHSLHRLHEQGASSAQRVTPSTGTAICHRPELTLEPPAKPRGALSASSQSAGDPKQDHKAPLHFPLLLTSLHCNYCQPCETAKWQGQREQQGGAGLAACNGGVLPQWHRGCPLGASSVTNQARNHRITDLSIYNNTIKNLISLVTGRMYLTGCWSVWTNDGDSKAMRYTHQLKRETKGIWKGYV